MARKSGKRGGGKGRGRSSKGSSGGRQRAYYFPGRNTPVIASSAAAARRQKRRPKSDRIVATRALKPGEGGGKGSKSQRWSRIRRDGKSPGRSKYGKGRGQGPPRKRAK